MKINYFIFLLISFLLISGVHAESGTVTFETLKDLLEDGPLTVDDYQRMKLAFNETEETYYAGQTLEKPYIAQSSSKSTVNYGDTLWIRGVSMGGNTTNAMLWIFSPTGDIKLNYGISSEYPALLKVHNDGSFKYEFIIGKNLESGIYNYFVQHPYYSADYDVWIYSNEIKTSLGDVYSIPEDITGRELSDIIINYINKPGIDDTYSKGMFMINPVPTETPTATIKKASEITEDDIDYNIVNASVIHLEHGETGKVNSDTLKKLLLDGQLSEEDYNRMIVKVVEREQQVEPTTAPTAYQTATLTAEPTQTATPKPTKEIIPVITQTETPLPTATATAAATEIPSNIKKLEEQNDNIINQVMLFFKNIFSF